MYRSGYVIWKFKSQLPHHLSLFLEPLSISCKTYLYGNWGLIPVLLSKRKICKTKFP
uniref:Uncharacterized protein n=1 Tax=Arundo donax TaxID=35708 RepID=A0A0A9GHI6_ARUDO